MKSLLLTLVVLTPLTGATQAAAQTASPLLTRDPPVERKPTLNLRLVDDRDFDSGQVQHSGMIGETEVMPNATLGFGLLKTAPKKVGIGDERPDSGAPRSRKAAIRFQLKF